MEIIIATEPTELLVAAGPPTWVPVEGMDLLYMSNTDSNAFLELLYLIQPLSFFGNRCIIIEFPGGSSPRSG